MPATDEKLNRIEDKLNKLMDRTKKLEDLITNHQELCKEFERFKNDYQLNNQILEDSVKDVPEMKKTIDFLKAENLVLKREISDMRTTIEDVSYKDISNKLEINGIPELAGENLNLVMLKVSEKIGEKIDASDVINVQREQRKKNNNASIIVTFKNTQLRDNFLVSGKKKKLNIKDLIVTKNDHKIFFNELLSWYSRKLFYEARMLKKECNYKYAWVKRGRVYLRKTDNEQAILVKKLEDIVTLRK